MAMNRAQMISVLNSMSDESLTTAMSAVGVQTGNDEMNLGQEETQGLQSWNSRDVSIPASPRSPIIDKSKFEKPIEPVQKPNYMLGTDDGLSDLTEYMPQEGMMEQ